MPRPDPKTRTFTTAGAPADLLAAIRRLVVAAFDGDFSDDDWEHTLGGRHVVVVQEDAILAHAAVVPRTLTINDHAWATGYVEGVAAAPERTGEGLGSQAMAEAGRLIRADFELGALSTEAHHFYERLGWERWQGPTYVRDGNELRRTADEDDGIMVLRCSPTQSLALNAVIACEARRGDDW